MPVNKFMWFGQPILTSLTIVLELPSRFSDGVWRLEFWMLVGQVLRSLPYPNAPRELDPGYI